MPGLQQIVTGTIINTQFHDSNTYARKALRKVFDAMERVYCYFAMSQVLFTHIPIRFPHIDRHVLYLVSLIVESFQSVSIVLLSNGLEASRLMSCYYCLRIRTSMNYLFHHGRRYLIDTKVLRKC